MRTLGSSELVLNPDGGIYHLDLRPGDLAPLIITVGDPDRVHEVSKYFDSIELKKGKREFLTHTGTLEGKRISVVSTGIGTDNMDIVLNELDALFNIDLPSRRVKEEKIQLSIIRIGTSGALQGDIPVDSFVLGVAAIGLDGLLHFYDSQPVRNAALEEALTAQLGSGSLPLSPYGVDCDPELAKDFDGPGIHRGISLTSPGFYGPQGRRLRLGHPGFDLEALRAFTFEGLRLTNLEMETAGLYGLAALLGHRAISLNAILANRARGEFSTRGQGTVDKLITYALERLVADQRV